MRRLCPALNLYYQGIGKTMQDVPSVHAVPPTEGGESSNGSFTASGTVNPSLDWHVKVALDYRHEREKNVVVEAFLFSL